MRLLHYLSRQSKLSLIVIGLVATLTLGLIDHLTGPELSFSIFYLLPISLAAWYIDRNIGFFLSLVSAGLWLAADLSAGRVYSHPLIPYWNMSVRLGFFLVVTYALSALRMASRRQEELAQFIVHDLRAPLANVITGLQQLDPMVAGSTATTPKMLVELCLASCDRMLTLVNSLLDLARLEKGQMPLRPVEVNPTEVVELSLRQVQLWAERNGVNLTSEIEGEVPAMYADPALTVSVLVNLLSNAIKFSPVGSVVQVNVGSTNAGMVAISVSDQGQGIPQAWAEKVFDKFSQLEARRVRGTVGSGLGLAFCRLAVEAQGGHIWLDSELNKGTTVTFTLPARAGQLVHTAGG
jgi:signal transduction histidine kinase